MVSSHTVCWILLMSDIPQTMVRTSITKLNADQVKRELKAVHDTTISSQKTPLPELEITVEPVYAGEREKEESRGRFQGRDQINQPWNNRSFSNKNHWVGYSGGNGNRGRHSANRGKYNGREKGENRNTQTTQRDRSIFPIELETYKRVLLATAFCVGEENTSRRNIEKKT